MNTLGNKLKTHSGYKVAEILFVFGLALLLIQLLYPIAGEDQIMQMSVVWVANLFMISSVYLGMRARGESWSDFGFTLRFKSWRIVGKTILYSLFFFALGMIGFILGSIVMANIVGIPEGADMSGYDYLRNNPGMLILSLVGVYIVSSFGEEVVYRGFLINRVKELIGNGKAAGTIAVLASSIIFGFAHYSWGPMGIGQTAFMGLALAICYHRFRNMTALFLAHAYMDTILLVQVYMASNV